MNSSVDTVHVLHVDDDEAFVSTAAALLEAADDRFTVQQATSVSDALDALRDPDITVDCIVSDYDMPGRNGIEFLEAVRETHPTLPFILFTGKGSEEVASDAISAGVTDYLQKEVGTSQYTVLANRLSNAVDRTRSTTALEESEKRLSLFIEQSPLGVIEFTETLDIAGVNPAAEEILGYDEAELVGERWDVIVSDRSYDDAAEVAAGLAAGDSGFHSIDENVRKNGEHIVCEWHNRVVRDDDGDVVAVFSQFQDVTDRAEREQEHDSRSRQFESVLDNTTTPMFMKDDEGEYLFVNKGHYDLFGFEGADLVGRTDHELFPQEMADEVVANDQRVLESEEATVVEERILVDGEPRQFLSTKVPIYDTGERADPDSPVAVFGVALDISERKQREQELLRYEAIVNSIHGAACIYDTEGRFSVVNDYLVDFYDTTREELIGRESRLISLVSEQEGFDVLEVLTSGERTEVSGEVEGDFGSPGEQVLSYRLVSLRDNGDVEGVVGTAHEITEYRRREAELERVNDQLEQFAGVVSHDLRNPLNVVGGRLDLAMDDCESEHLPPAKRALDRSLSLIDDLLALARTREQTLSLDSVSLAAVADDSWDATLHDDATLTVETDLTFEANRSQLRQLLTNVVTNAVNHGGSRVEVGALDDDGENGFYVADNGPGIPDDRREQVFEMGYSTAADGTGFGLAIVADIAHRHGWTVRATESDHGGTRIEVRGVERVR